MLTDILKFANENAAFVSMIATVVLAITTVVYAISTHIIATENRLLRKAGTEPDVVAYLMPNPVHLVVINLVVVNVGEGPAFDVEISFDADPADFQAHEVRYQAKSRRRIAAVLPQGERFVQMFGGGEALYQPEPLKDFTVTVHFKDVRGNGRHNSSKASIAEFEGFGGFDPPEQEIAASVKRIAAAVDNWSSGFKRLKVETITRNEQIEENTALRGRHRSLDNKDR